MRVGESCWKCENSANRTPPQQAIPKQLGDRLVTEGSRLVTRPILFVNAGVRKHRITVSGVTRRTFRRAATRLRDSRFASQRNGCWRDETLHWNRLSSVRSPAFSTLASFATDRVVRASRASPHPREEFRAIKRNRTPWPDCVRVRRAAGCATDVSAGVLKRDYGR